MGLPRWFLHSLCGICGVSILLSVLPLSARNKKDALQYGMGLIVNVPASEADVLKAVGEVAQNGMIRGTKEYAKDQFVGGATEVNDCRLFAPWTDGGKVFYKVREHALDPYNFKNATDVGALAVRYVVMKQDETHTVLRIDAIFVEDFRHLAHASDGSVESAEYKDIHDHVESYQLMKDQAAEAAREKEEGTQGNLGILSTPPAASDAQFVPEEAVKTPAVTATASIEDLQKKVRELRQLTERKVKVPGTTLKSAPFHTASNLQALPAGTEVLIVVSTPYWFGVETHEGQHGWVLRDDLEEMP